MTSVESRVTPRAHRAGTTTRLPISRRLPNGLPPASMSSGSPPGGSRRIASACPTSRTVRRSGSGDIGVRRQNAGGPAEGDDRRRRHAHDRTRRARPTRAARRDGQGGVIERDDGPGWGGARPVTHGAASASDAAPSSSLTPASAAHAANERTQRRPGRPRPRRAPPAAPPSSRAPRRGSARCRPATPARRRAPAPAAARLRRPATR